MARAVPFHPPHTHRFFSSVPSRSADQFAWLGLLKWSLQYQDGTSDTEVTEMTEENKRFLEKVRSAAPSAAFGKEIEEKRREEKRREEKKETIEGRGSKLTPPHPHRCEQVMTEGIVNEKTRMKQILSAFTSYIKSIKSLPSSETPASPPTSLLDELDELRDILEQIDFSVSFAKMNALPFLLSAASDPAVPLSLRGKCLEVVATMCQNNPQVQDVAREADGIKMLGKLWESLEQQQGEEDEERFRVSGGEIARYCVCVCVWVAMMLFVVMDCEVPSYAPFLASSIPFFRFLLSSS